MAELKTINYERGSWGAPGSLLVLDTRPGGGSIVRPQAFPETTSQIQIFFFFWNVLCGIFLKHFVVRVKP